MNSDCIIAPGLPDKDGYIRAWHQGCVVGAHRVAFFTLYGWWPPVVRHTCDNPPCRNPAHLIPGTQVDNVQDRMDRGRQAKGSTQHLAKLTDAIVSGARREHASGGVSYATLGRRYGVTSNAMRDAIVGKTWKHMPLEGQRI